MFPISFKEFSEEFIPLEAPASWIDTSFAESKQAIGWIRLPIVNNGNYPSKHALKNPNGDIIGYLVDGASDLCYTYECVSVRDSLWIAHIPGVWSPHYLSKITRQGRFWFSDDYKYKRSKSISIGEGWADYIKCFKLMPDGESIFLLTKKGFLLLDTGTCSLRSHVHFQNLSYCWSNFSVSPRFNLLAICFFQNKGKDIIDDSDIYQNFIRIYGIKTGEILGECILDSTTRQFWEVNFSKDGRKIRVNSDLGTYTYELINNKP